MINVEKLLEERAALNQANATLHKQLREANETINAIRNDTIDALIIDKENDFKVFTEKTSDKAYRILIEKMHEGAVMLHEDGRILYCNAYFATMVKQPLQRIIGTLFANFIDNPTKKSFEVLCKTESVNSLKEEIVIYASDGNKIPVLMTVDSLRLDNNIVLGIILTDLTVQIEHQNSLTISTNQLLLKIEELKIINLELAFQIEEKEQRVLELSIAKTDVKELEGLNTHKETILSVLSHDLRSPLSGIIQLSQLLKEQFESLDKEPIKEILGLMHKASTDELRMLDNLVDWARVKHASDAFSPAEIKLDRYVKNVFDMLNENAIVKKLTLISTVEDNICVFADEKMLLSIIQNIVSNAIKHTPEKGVILVSAKRDGDRIIVKIKDDGIGMSNEVKEKLFSPQIDSLSNARNDDKGAGIGLLLAKSFAEKNDGKIWVESSEGKGSSFYFTLPAIQSFDKTGRANKTK